MRNHALVAKKHTAGIIARLDGPKARRGSQWAPHRTTARQARRQGALHCGEAGVLRSLHGQQQRRLRAAPADLPRNGQRRPARADERVGIFRCLGACQRRTPRTRADLKVPPDAPHGDLASNATLRFDLGISMRRRVVKKRSLRSDRRQAMQCSRAGSGAVISRRAAHTTYQS